MRREYTLVEFILMVIVLCFVVAAAEFGCSALNPRMSPPIRSAFEEWDRETGNTVYRCEVEQMRCRNGVIEVQSFNMGPEEWRRVDPDHDWDVWVARWAWED